MTTRVLLSMFRQVGPNLWQAFVHGGTNVCSQPRMPSSQTWAGRLRWYYLWPPSLPAYDKKDLRRGELEGHLSCIKLRPTTCADLEAVCKKRGDGIELC